MQQIKVRNKLRQQLPMFQVHLKLTPLKLTPIKRVPVPKILNKTLHNQKQAHKTLNKMSLKQRK